MRFFHLIFLAFVALAGCVPTAGDTRPGAPFVRASCFAAGPGLATRPVTEGPPPADRASPSLRLVTFNIHSGLGPRFAFSQSREAVRRHLDGIAAAIHAAAPGVDVVGLNEVDFMAARSGGFDQARYLARALGALTGRQYEVVYGETWRRYSRGREARFGNAALVRRPLLARAACLYEDPSACAAARAVEPRMPPPAKHSGLRRWLGEPRGLIKLTLDFEGRPLDVVVTHLDAFALAEREMQAARLLRRIVDPDRTTVVLGDFNAVPTLTTYGRALFASDRTHDILTSGPLADARAMFGAGDIGFSRWATYPAASPVWPLDGVLGSLDLSPRDVKVVASTHSDHHGLYVEYALTRDPAALLRRRARHDGMRRRQLARLLDCDLTRLRGARLHRLIAQSGYVEVATAMERRAMGLIEAPTAMAGTAR